MSSLVWVTVFAVCVAVSNAGVIQQYSSPVTYTAPAVKVGPAASSHASFTQHTATVHAAPVAYAAPVAHYAAPIAKVASYAAPIAKAVVAEPYAPPHYDFAYAVHDPHTGDVKEQKESRKDDVVQGMYSLIEADGSRRIVEYTADDHNGFQAVVHREPAAHPVTVKAVAPLIKTLAAPIVKYAAPVAAVKYAAPAATYVSYSAPTHLYHH